MAYDYVSKRTTATNLLTKFGTTAYLDRYESIDTYTKSYDPVLKKYKWTKVSDGTVTYTEPTGSLKQYTYKSIVSNYNIKEIDNVNVLYTDKKVILSYNVVIPLANEILEIDSVKYKVINVDVVKPANDIILYKVQVRI